ncbi:tetraprenyl-beta-curcumene synthase family protein [Oceanobacillus saliphilus]|uniref:tetraprenyl-beta-curcumene synthase family protein n=1 Tax=Oceanobacillus saliphilus TaxID=2925834 RepID=UPI0027D26EFA|nr:tetraprenyl-beta-curcumene synthase family protein [Oceanobacillus saliphilus]
MFQKIFPMVDEEINYWRNRAKQIPNEELRTQAIASIDSKKFHCQGGGVYSLLAGNQNKTAIRFIVAYQTISDYLDNLCDRSTSLNPHDFRLLHQSLKDALTPENDLKNYYRFREEQEDGGYLAELVATCQDILKNLKGYEYICNQVWQLEELYADLQVHKHVKAEERIPRLTNWHEQNKKKAPELTWYEFSAATGSTLGIFCLISYFLGGKIDEKTSHEIYDSYFPYIQGLHIMLDYYIDQQEDRMEGDLNFCTYYEDENHMKERFDFFIKQSNLHAKKLPDRKFHEMIIHGLVGLYLADNKVRKMKGSNNMSKALLKSSGTTAKFINFHIKFYYKMENS